MRPLSQVLEVYLLPQRLAAWVAAAMGIFGIVLAGVGVYGVAAFAASRRAKEVAIRMALGATDRDVTRLLVRERFAIAPAAGLLVGLIVGVACRFVAAQLIPGVRAADPIALTVVGAAVGLSPWSPSRSRRERCSGARPMGRLRDE